MAISTYLGPKRDVRARIAEGTKCIEYGTIMSRQIHELGIIPDEFLVEFAKQIIVRRAKGMKEIEGKTFEQMLCEQFEVPWKGSNNGLTDALIQEVAFSVKSRLWDTACTEKDGSLKRVSTVIGRCSPDTFDGSHIEKNVTPANEAGAKVVSIWNARLEEAKKSCKEFRQITILKSSDLSKWAIFEFAPTAFNPDDFVWCWEVGKGKKATNLYGRSENIRLTWQPNGSQLTLNMQIPAQYRSFRIPKTIQTMGDAGVLDQIGFSDDWIAQDTD